MSSLPPNQLNTPPASPYRQERTRTPVAPNTENFILGKLMCLLDQEEKNEAVRKENEYVHLLIVEQKKAIQEWQKGLKLREELLRQRQDLVQLEEKKMTEMLKIREQALKHRENSVHYWNAMYKKREVRLDYVETIWKLLEENQPPPPPQ